MLDNGLNNGKLKKKTNISKRITLEFPRNSKCSILTNLHIISFLVLTFFYIALVDAADFTGEIYNINTNLTINVTNTIYYDVREIGTNYISFEGLRSSETTTDKLTINLTEINKTYYGIDLPYITTNSDNQKTIVSNITQNITGSITYVTHSCTDVTKLSYRSATGLQTLNYTITETRSMCSGGVITINNITIQSGNNVFSVHGIEEEFFSFGIAIEFILAILPIITIIIVYIILKLMFNGKINSGMGLGLIVLLLIMIYISNMILNTLLEV